MTPAEEMAFNSAKANLTMLQDMQIKMPSNPQMKKLVDDAQAAVAKLTPQYTPPQPAPGTVGTNIEQRIARLEQLVQEVAAPAIDEAAKTGMAIMSALGQSMTPEQAQWVQQRVNTSPQFFASEQCKAAIDILIHEWQTFEGAAK